MNKNKNLLLAFPLGPIFRKSFFSTFAAGLTGCALALPTHHSLPPQVLAPKKIMVGLGISGDAVIGPDFRKHPEVTEPISDTGKIELYWALKFGVGILPRVDLIYEMSANQKTNGHTRTLGPRVQWLGSPIGEGKKKEWSATLQWQYIQLRNYRDDRGDWSPSDSNNMYGTHNLFFENVEGKGYAVSQLFGYQLGDDVTVYAGPKHMEVKVDFEFREEGPDGTLYKQSRIANVSGVVTGFSFAGKGGFFVIEYGRFHVPNMYRPGNHSIDVGSIGGGIIFN